MTCPPGLPQSPRPSRCQHERPGRGYAESPGPAADVPGVPGVAAAPAPQNPAVAERAAAQSTPWPPTALASPDGAWPQDGGPEGHPAPLSAKCTVPPRKPREGEAEPPPHGPVPAKRCTCGIYATTSLDVINGYLSAGSPVLGI